MAIEHFATLLDDVLNGKTSALSLADTVKKGHALNLRALMHKSAKGGPKNYPEAIRLYDEAIKLGHSGAINHRASMHQHAQGGPQNDLEAIRLL